MSWMIGRFLEDPRANFWCFRDHFWSLGDHFWRPGTSLLRSWWFLGTFSEQNTKNPQSVTPKSMIFGGFWRFKSDQKTCFVRTSLFYEKTWFFENRAGALVKAIILKGQGRFRRSSKPTKTTKIMKKSSQKCMKKARSKNMTNHEKTEKHEKQGPLRNTAYTSKNWGFHQSRTGKTKKNKKKQGCEK